MIDFQRDMQNFLRLALHKFSLLDHGSISVPTYLCLDTLYHLVLFVSLLIYLPIHSCRLIFLFSFLFLLLVEVFGFHLKNIRVYRDYARCNVVPS